MSTRRAYASAAQLSRLHEARSSAAAAVLRVRVIPDNYATHQTPDGGQRLRRRPRVRIHFTRTDRIRRPEVGFSYRSEHRG